MLSALNIRNFALIDSLELQFHQGLTVFTGETGSGKSIILGALNLILGERADFRVIRDTSKKSIVEATFTLKKEDYEDFFLLNNLDFSTETIIRREINATGKSRAFVNDTPVQLNILQELSSRLVKIHSQYHTYALKSKQFQLNLVDGIVGNQLNHYQQEFKAWKKLQQQTKEIHQQIIDSEKQADYVQFQIEELEQLQLDQHDYNTLEKQLLQLENAAEIIQQFSTVHQGLGEDNGIIDQLNSLNGMLSKSIQLHPELADLSERISSIIMELKDIDETAIDAGENFDIPQEDKDTLTSKLDFFNRLLLKHHADNQEELMEIYNEFQTQNSSSESLKQHLSELEKQLNAKEKLVLQEAEKLHEARLKNKETIALRITQHLKELKMADAQLEIRVEKTAELSDTGYSNVEIFFTTNKGSSLQPISKVASGGELSRLMLVIEKLLSETQDLPTLLLDEIDTGVSGEVALKIGNMLSEMGKNMQLFAITHLPQVAAKGQHHLKVYKEDLDEKTITQVRELTTDERLVEIASLMSGEKVNEAAIENAKILMK